MPPALVGAPQHIRICPLKGEAEGENEVALGARQAPRVVVVEGVGVSRLVARRVDEPPCASPKGAEGAEGDLVLVQ